MMERFNSTMGHQFELMRTVLQKIQQGTEELVDVQKGTVSLAGGGFISELRQNIRSIASQHSTNMAHIQLASRINQDDSHHLHQLLRTMDDEASLRKSSSGMVPVLNINPFHRDPLRWTEEPASYETVPARHYVVRILCATSRRHALVTEALRDMERHSTTQCFASKHPF
jgi:hypothetical protein